MRSRWSLNGIEWHALVALAEWQALDAVGYGDSYRYQGAALLGVTGGGRSALTGGTPSVLTGVRWMLLSAPLLALTRPYWPLLAVIFFTFSLFSRPEKMLKMLKMIKMLNFLTKRLDKGVSHVVYLHRRSAQTDTRNQQ